MFGFQLEIKSQINKRKYTFFCGPKERKGP